MRHTSNLRKLVRLDRNEKHDSTLRLFQALLVLFLSPYAEHTRRNMKDIL
jgi:hypothetical protein